MNGRHTHTHTHTRIHTDRPTDGRTRGHAKPASCRTAVKHFHLTRRSCDQATVDHTVHELITRAMVGATMDTATTAVLRSVDTRRAILHRILRSPPPPLSSPPSSCQRRVTDQTLVIHVILNAQTLSRLYGARVYNRLFLF